ncbi:MAG: restriction endonuclease subunit S [Loktanella sp.]|nr:restriction endonuclease subunit S [Loktanella sp.]
MKDFAKSGWEAAPLGKVAQIRPNKKEAKSVLADSDDVSFVPMDCLKIDQVALAEHEARPLGEVYGGYTYFRDGDVLLAKITPCFENGKLGVANGLKNGIGFGSSEFFVLRPNDKLLAGYLYHFMNRQRFRDWAKGQMTGAVGHKRVPKELIETLEIPLPPLEEQQRIVAVLDEAFEGLARARAHAEANLSDAEEIAARSLDVILEDLGTRNGRITMDGIAAVKGGKRLPKGSKPSSTPTLYPYISVKDLTEDGTVSTAKLGYISEQVQRSIARYTISCRDVYISIAGTIGKSGIVPDELEGANLTENAAKLVLKDGWAAEYIYWCTRSANFAVQTSEQTRVAAQPKLALQRLGAITIPKATEAEQIAVCEKMNALRVTRSELVEAYNKKLQDLDDLRQSLLGQAFAGKLT